MNDGLILGLDGLDFDFVARHRRDFPNLDQFFQDSGWGRLTSTIPPATSAAWTTGLSGMSPGRTGITDFTDDEDSVVTSANVAAPRVWDVIQANEGRSAVLGVPLTYPVTELDGVMVSGFLTPESAPTSERVYPTDLTEAIPEGYEYSIPYSDYGDDSADELLDTLYASTDAKFDLLEATLRDELPADGPFDLVCFVLSETDWIQHYFRVNPEESEYESSEQTVVDFVSHVDERVGRVLELVEDRTVGVLSDHGFGKYTRNHVYVNEWLRREGYFVPDESDSTASLKRAVAIRLRDLLRIPGMNWIKSRLPKSVKKQALDATTLSESDIDWEETVATYHGKFNNTGYVELTENISPDRRDDLVEEIETGLETLRDPHEEVPVVSEVYRREEYYDGPFVESIPEVVFIFESDYSGNETFGGENLVQPLAGGTRPAPAHAMDGIYAVRGPQVDPREQDANIVDFLPTVYSALDIPLPEKTDGSILDGIVENSLSERRSYEQAVPTTGNHDGDDAEVRGRLEDLGYM